MYINSVARAVLLVCLMALLGLPCISHAAPPFDPTLERLAFCTNVLAYAANLFLMQNNEGAARVAILQQARATVALFSLHSQEGQTIDRLLARRRTAKPFLDANPDKVVKTIYDCQASTDKIATVQARKYENFYEKVEEAAAQARALFGLR